MRWINTVFFCLLSVSIFGQAGQTPRDESNTLVNAGLDKFMQNDFNGAITDFTRAIKADAANPLAYYNRGLSKYHLKDYYGAIEDCNKAIDLAPDDANAYNIRGLTQHALRKKKEAMADYKKAIKLDPASYWGYFNRGILHEDMEEFDKALADYTKSIELNIDHVESYQNRGVVYFKLREFQKALTDFNQAIYLQPKNPALLLNRAMVNTELQNCENAIADYEKVIELDPQNHTAYYNSGVCYRYLRRMDKACWAWEKAMRLGNPFAEEAMSTHKCGGEATARENRTVVVDPGIKSKANILEKSNLTEEDIRNYLAKNQARLDAIEGIWSANSTEVRNETEKLEEPNFGRVAILRDTVSAARDFIMVFMEGKKYFPWTLIAELTSTSYENVFLTQVYALNGLKDPWNFTIDEVGLLSGKKNYMEGGTQVYKELFFVKIFPKEAAKGTKEKEPSSGSGFLISAEGMIATNAHVVSGYQKIRAEIITAQGKESYNLKMLMKDEINDVALLKVEDPAFRPPAELPYGIDEDFSVGQRVYTLGFPMAHLMGTEYKAADGIISSKNGAKDDIRYMQITVPLQPGNSGGPLFNENGNVIGITSARLSGEAQNVGYALKSAYLKNLIKMADQPYATGKDKLKGLPLEKQIQSLKNYICLIRAE